MKTSMWLFSMVILFTTNSCANMARRQAIKRITVEKKAIPPDFGKDESEVLICIITDKNMYDRYVKKHVINEYHGKYKFMLYSDIGKDGTDDVSKFRYIFHGFRTRSKDFDGSMHTEFQYYIIDRLEEETYNCPFVANGYGQLIKKYMIALEHTRLQYQKSE